MWRTTTILANTGREAIINLPLRKLVWPLVFPAVLQSFVVGINTMVDGIYIARLINETALTAMAFTSPFMVIITALTSLLSIGAGALFSRSIGKEDTQQQQTIMGFVWTMAFVIGLPVGLVFLLYSDILAKAIGISGNLLPYATGYLQYIMGGIALHIASLSLIAMVRCIGETGKAFWIMATGVGSNLLLVPLFITMFNWGIKGAAVATLLSYGMMIVLAGYTLRHISPRWPFSKTNLPLLKEMLLIGFSAFLMQITGFVKQFVLYRLVVQYGHETDQTFFAAAQRLYAFAVLPLFGFLQALQPVVGINFGNGNHIRTHESVVVFRKYAMTTLLIIAICCVLACQSLIRILLPGYSMSTIQLFQYSLLFAVMAIAPLGSTVMVYWQTTGKKYAAVVMGLLKDVVLFISISAVCTSWWGITGVYAAVLTENLLYGILMLYFFNRLKNPVPLWSGDSIRFIKKKAATK